MLFRKELNGIICTVYATSLLFSSRCQATRNTPYELSLQKDLHLDEREFFETNRHPSGSTQNVLQHNRHQYLRQEDNKRKSKINKGDTFHLSAKGKVGKASQPLAPTHFDLQHVNYRFLLFEGIENFAKNFIMNDTSHHFEKKNTNKRRRMSTKRDEEGEQGDDYDHGWVPVTYPNPIQNPELCHVPYAFRAGGENDTSKKSILFCDPDQILIDEDQDFVGRALVDFSMIHDHVEPGCDTQNDYNIGVSQDWKYRMTGTAFADLEENGKVSSLGGSFIGERKTKSLAKRRVEIGVAIAKKIDVDAILRKFQFYSFDDTESMTDDAAQFFASIVHNQWYGSSVNDTGVSSEGCDEEENEGINGILIFLSIEDRVCFITSGESISAVLPWWRLEQVVSGMKEELRRENYSGAIIGAIQEISEMLNKPPTLSEKLKDFFSRFGLIFLFSLSTFALAVYGEIRERQRRFEMAEINTRLTEVEEEKARMLQKTYKTDCCPICLEDFDREDNMESNGIPSHGSDGKPVKMLRCGHIFCSSCWRTWIESGNGDPSCCPVCRRDITKSEFTQQNEQLHLLAPADGSTHEQNYGAATITFNESTSNDPNFDISIL